MSGLTYRSDVTEGFSLPFLNGGLKASVTCGRNDDQGHQWILFAGIRPIHERFITRRVIIILDALRYRW